ncbi:hypothetical protein BH09PLA1_BH09PLA1_00580 [soil metagenome]
MSHRSNNLSHVESLEARRLLSAAAMSALMGEYGQTPLSFEQNLGQIDARADFLARGNGYSLFLSDGGKATLSLRAVSAKDAADAQSVVLGMRLLGGNAKVSPTGVNGLAGKVNSFVGDASQWVTNVPTFGDVMYDDVYRGIDLVYYGSNQRQLEYDFKVAPGANPSAIRLAFDGADRLQLDGDGNLILQTGGSSVRLAAPVSYQNVKGRRVAVNSEFVLGADGAVSFKLGKYDASKALVIDPVLSYSTYLGGTGYDAGLAIAVDAAGSAYVTGQTGTADFPTTTGAFRTDLGGASNAAFITKLNPAGTALVYSSYLGGGLYSQTVGYGIAVDAGGNAYVTGETGALNFPTTPGAFTSPNTGGDEAFVTKLNPQGNGLVYSFILGSDSDDHGTDIAVDAAGNASVTGWLNNNSLPPLGPGFPTVNAFQPNYGGGFQDAFVTKVNAAGSALIFSTYLGGPSFSSDWGEGVAADAQGNTYVVGDTYGTDFPSTAGAFNRDGAVGLDAFVTKFSPTGAVVYSTHALGGSGHEEAYGIAVDAAGSAYITGNTDSWDDPSNSIDTGFPTTASAFQRTIRGQIDVFVAKLNPAGSALVYGTYLGGSANPGDPGYGVDRGWGIAVDSAGSAYVTGDTDSPNFPVLNSIQPFNPWNKDVFVTKLSPSGSSLVYSTYLGGNFYDGAMGIAVDPTGNAYVTGSTNSSGFPTTPGAFQPANAGGTEHFDDAFITKISDTSNPTVGLTALSMTPDQVQAGTQSQGTVTLSGPAPAGGIVVTLKSARTDVATVPATLTIPAGAISATFSTLTTTLPVGWDFSAGTVISATLNGGTRTFTLTVTPAPFNATTGLFDLNGPSGPVVRVTFNLGVDSSTLSAADLRILNAAGQPSGISASSVSYNAPTRTATWSFIGAFANGNYTALLPAGSVASSNAEPSHVAYSLPFFFMQGDADHNGVVNFDDYAHIDNGFNNGLIGFSNGDFNYDGVINFDDYSLIDFAFNSQA